MLGMYVGLALLTLVSLQEVQGPPAPPTPAAGWSFLNGIDVVVNDRVLTHLEVIASLRDVTSEEELLEQLGKIRVDRIHMFLEDQAGRDMGLDPQQVEAILRYTEEDRIERLGGIQAASEQFRSRETDVVYMREFLEEDFYATTWRRWQSGTGIGPRGRISRDNYVRPGVLQMIYGVRPTAITSPARSSCAS